MDFHLSDLPATILAAGFLLLAAGAVGYKLRTKIGLTQAEIEAAPAEANLPKLESRGES